MTDEAREARKPCILVVGDSMVDRYVTGETNRISPEAPVPIVIAGPDDMRAGGAANVAANVRGLDIDCVLLTISGDDQGGRDLARLMAASGVELDCVVDQGQRTTEKIRLISGAQQIARVDRDGQVSAAARAELARRFEYRLTEASAIIFSDYAKGALTDLAPLIALARRHGVKVFVDPKSPDAARYRGAFLLKPNAREFHAMFGECPDDKMADRARGALTELDLDYLVITRGAKGIMMLSRDGAIADHPSEALEVFDVTGAGDTIIAALAAGIVQGLPMGTAIDQANLAASIAISRPGTHVVTRSDLEDRLDRRNSSMPKLSPLPMLQRKLARARERGARVVFTNGCFDILHAGHVLLFDRAKKQGDILVVGLNGDESVRRLKGASRPVNALTDRIEVLSALTAIDHIVTFDDDTPLDLIRAIQPDVLVKGGDYAPGAIVGADCVRAAGGEIMIVPLLAGRSTTAILAARRPIE